MTYSTDTDLLHWEPNLFRDAAAVAQTLLSGTGTLAGTSFTIPAGSFTDLNIGFGYTITLGEPFNGTYPIVTINSATSLTLSVLYDQLYPDSGDAIPVSVGSGTTIPFFIRTFWPQRRIVSELLEQAAGVGISRPGEVPASIVGPDVLKRACALGTLQMVYSALGAIADEQAPLIVRADMYERLYRRALRSTKVQIDLNGDGEADCVRALNVMNLVRL